MSKILVMTFRNEEGRAFRIRLRYPREDLSSQDVNAVMDLILARNVFATSGGDLVEKVGAQIVETSTTSL
ncbi:DUF2922 family protein [Candidatus Caldatribacterium saccharofermentans]|mgnify:CR=1 FL=1|uniref:DUF2922 domain-containing protein n=1 Tax=Candidatus Caldatribacterium saccharofermentans TaxID=1454753 RepID=A0A7V4WKG6_9BACT